MPSLFASYTHLSVISSAETVSSFSVDLFALSSTPSTQDRVAHLSNLQASLKKLQSDVNAFLTDKMVQDKTAGVAKGDDAKDEETYGEEIIDED